MIDFLHPSFIYRLESGGGIKQALAKACGLKPDLKPKILDATAGLGRDGFVLAHLGCKVTLIERHELVAEELQRALLLAKQEESLSQTIERISLYHGDATAVMPAIEKHDVIYLDPMFPERNKSALVKKNLRDLKNVVGEDLDADALLEAALPLAKRVVVKRPKSAPYLMDLKPSYQLIGKANRFDVYVGDF